MELENINNKSAEREYKTKSVEEEISPDQIKEFESQIDDFTGNDSKKINGIINSLDFKDPQTALTVFQELDGGNTLNNINKEADVLKKTFKEKVTNFFSKIPFLKGIASKQEDAEKLENISDNNKLSHLHQILMSGQINYDSANELVELCENRKKLEKIVLPYLVKYNLPAKDIWKAWEQGGVWVRDSLLAIQEIESVMPGSAKILHDKFNISDFGRYPSEVLINQCKNSEKDVPYGVLVFPVADHSGSFNQDVHAIQQLYKNLQGKYELRIVEAGGKFGFAKRLVECNDKYGSENKISFAIIGGHGEKDNIMLGTEAKRNIFSKKSKNMNELTKDDINSDSSKKIVNSFFEEDASFVLVSCSTGKEGGIGQEISKVHGNIVTAPAHPSLLRNFSVSFRDGKPPVISASFINPELYIKDKNSDIKQMYVNGSADVR